MTETSDRNKFVDCAIACNATYLVSQDKHFNILETILFPKVQVLKVNQFVEVLNDSKNRLAD
ncbi:MAG: hypothetical protein U5N85_02500 [Arcicella sp.]|nr:hypothetical protein [Arcicella sp.]